MSSLSEAPSLEELMGMQRNQGLPLFLPVIVGFATSAPSQDHRESGESRSAREDLIVMNPISQSMIVIEGWGNWEALLGEWANKKGPLPASKASIEAMPVVKITEKGAECAICLGEYEVGGEAKEMPCKHRYHSGCIEKWLGIHGSCPICRYKMPSAERDEKRRGDGRDLNSDAESGNDSLDVSRRGDGVAADGSSAQEMDIDNNESNQDMQIDNN